MSSMTRVNSGTYTTTINGQEYTVAREDGRIETGKTEKGAAATFWVARRGSVEEGTELGRAETYKAAKEYVFSDDPNSTPEETDDTENPDLESDASADADADAVNELGGLETEQGNEVTEVQDEPETEHEDVEVHPSETGNPVFSSE